MWISLLTVSWPSWLEAVEGGDPGGLAHVGSLCAPTASDPCQPSPCSPLAQCSVGPRGQAQCRCPENYHGDGTVCLPQDPCVTNNGGCPSNSTLCLYRKPGQVSWRPPAPPPLTLAVGPSRFS